jgi:hypothetical protein
MRARRFTTAASLLAVSALLGACDVPQIKIFAPQAQEVSTADATRAVDQLFSAVARGELETAAQTFAADLPGGTTGPQAVQSLRDGPLRMVERVIWNASAPASSSADGQRATLEGVALLINGDDVPIRAELTRTSGRWQVVSIVQTGQQRNRQVRATPAPIPASAPTPASSEPADGVQTRGTGAWAVGAGA